jgi:hypothetical protein
VFRGIVAVTDKDFCRSCGERVWHNGILTRFKPISGNEIGLGRSAFGCATGLRQSGRNSSFSHPALAPQRGTRLRDRTGLLSFVPSGTRATWAERGCSPAKRALPPTEPLPRHPALRRVSLFVVQRRRETEARHGFRASGLHDRDSLRSRGRLRSTILKGGRLAAVFHGFEMVHCPISPLNLEANKR